MQTFDDMVVLVPGFLGFARIGGFYYFAERVSAAVRGALETRLGRSVPVVPGCTLPTDHLAARQHKLVAELAKMVRRAGGVKRLHLVGHSTGAVDIQLLTCRRPLDSDRWNDEAEQVRRRIRTVVGIAAPHHGTCLADSAPAGAFADPLANVAAFPGLAGPLWSLSRLIVRNAEAPEIVAYMLDHLPDSAKFMWNVASRRGLIDDLSTRAMAAVRANSDRNPNVIMRSFVTVVPSCESAEPFFKDLRRLTEDTTTSVGSPTVERSLLLLRNWRGTVIRSGGQRIEFSLRSSDGVINSARQILDPDDPNELAGIVVGDHGDVLGHYDRLDELVSDAVLNHGLFHSGAGFRDDQFFELYGEVANVVAESIRSL
jgi:pimeloyl-ACP methyl ester carboxylesterase